MHYWILQICNSFKNCILNIADFCNSFNAIIKSWNKIIFTEFDNFSWQLRNILYFILFAISIIQFAKVYYKFNDKVFPFCQEISVTYYCKTIAILLRNSAILFTYCSIAYCNSAIPQHYCYCFVQYSEKLLAVSLPSNISYTFWPLLWVSPIFVS